MKIIMCLPCIIIQSTIFSWSQHAFIDNERNVHHPLPFIRSATDIFQEHHNDPGGVCKRDSIWFNGTKSHCLYSIPTIITTLIAHKYCKDKIMVWYSAISLVIGYVCIRNHIICHASKRGYAIDIVCKTGHKLGLLPNPEYHAKHHTHSNRTKYDKIDATNCESGSSYQKGIVCTDRTRAHAGNWAFMIPKLSEVLEYVYLDILGGPNTDKGYYFVQSLFWLSCPHTIPLWFLAIKKSRATRRSPV